MKSSSLTAALLWAAFSLPANAEVVIQSDGGGHLQDYAVQAQTYRVNNERIRFDGWCGSACTLYMSVPGACVTPNAHFGFHLPYGDTPEGNVQAKNWLMQQYPEWIRHWIYSQGGLSRQGIVMPYTYAVKFIPRCPP